MKNKAVRTEEDIERTFDTYADTIYSLSLMMLKNKSDAEDVVQDVFVKYMRYEKTFADDEHKKAWLLRVANNLCIDHIRYNGRHREESIDYISDLSIKEESTGILEALGKLPERYRIILILHYVHEYKVREISEILKISESASKMRLKKGRELLEKLYRREFL